MDRILQELRILDRRIFCLNVVLNIFRQNKIPILIKINKVY